MKSPAPILLLAIILVIIIATATASIDNGLVAADGNVKHALQSRSNLRKLKHGKGEDVQEDDNVKVRTHGIPPAV